MSLIALIFKREGLNEITYLDQNDDLNFLFLVMRFFESQKIFSSKTYKQCLNLDSTTDFEHIFFLNIITKIQICRSIAMRGYWREIGGK